MFSVVTSMEVSNVILVYCRSQGLHASAVRRPISAMISTWRICFRKAAAGRVDGALGGIVCEFHGAAGADGQSSEAVSSSELLLFARDGACGAPTSAGQSAVGRDLVF